MLSVTDSTYLVGEAPYGQATFSQKDSVVTITIALEHFPPTPFMRYTCIRVAAKCQACTGILENP